MDQALADGKGRIARALNSTRLGTFRSARHSCRTALEPGTLRTQAGHVWRVIPLVEVQYSGYAWQQSGAAYHAGEINKTRALLRDDDK